MGKIAVANRCADFSGDDTGDFLWGIFHPELSEKYNQAQEWECGRTRSKALRKKSLSQLLFPIASHHQLSGMHSDLAVMRAMQGDRQGAEQQFRLALIGYESDFSEANLESKMNDPNFNKRYRKVLVEVENHIQLYGADTSALKVWRDFIENFQSK